MKKTVLGVSCGAALCVIGVCLAGILLGSFLDYRISVLLEHKTSVGSAFAAFGAYFSYCLYPAAGMCLYKGLKRRGKRFGMLAALLLAVGYFLAVYYAYSYSGDKIRDILGYAAGESSPWLSAVAWLLCAALYLWVPFVSGMLLDDKNPDKLIAVGAAILIAGVLADNVNLWLKQAASRPRYKYLLTLEDPLSQFRNWWEMTPHLAGADDSFKSWPSGNMTIAAMLFSLPMLTDLFKKRRPWKNWTAFGFVCAFVALFGYNRIHMTSHYLTDVCFGVLITYLIFAAVSTAFLRSVRDERRHGESGRPGGKRK